MEFIVGLPMSSHRHDVIMVVVGRLTKVAHFSSVCSSYNASSVAKIFMKDIVQLHKIPHRIISNRDLVFTSTLWTSLQHALGT